MKIDGGNLSPEVTDAELHALFVPYGKVESAAIVKEKHTARPTGFGFVLMPSRPEATVAITALRGQNLKGRKLTVKESPLRAPQKPIRADARKTARAANEEARG